jgi:hypothetical protein
MRIISISFVTILLLLIGMFRPLSAQTIPLARGNQWRYVYSDHPADTVRETIMADTLATVACNRESAQCSAWLDDAGHYYVIMPRGMMLAHAAVAGKRGLQPILFIPKAGADPGGPSCVMFVAAGTSTVATPAGTFENCLVYDDKRVARIYIKPGVGIVKEEIYAEPGKERVGERPIVRTRMLVSYSLVR